MELHEMLRKKRDEMNLTQKEIAQKLYISNKTYSQYERGERNIETNTLFKILELLNIDIDDVMTVDLETIKKRFSHHGDQIHFILPNTRITRRKKGFLSLIIAKFYDHIEEVEKGEKPIIMEVKIEEIKRNSFNLELINKNGYFPFDNEGNRHHFFEKGIEDIKNGKLILDSFGNNITLMLAVNEQIISYHFEGIKNNGTIFNITI